MQQKERSFLIRTTMVYDDGNIRREKSISYTLNSEKGDLNVKLLPRSFTDLTSIFSIPVTSLKKNFYVPDVMFTPSGYTIPIFDHVKDIFDTNAVYEHVEKLKTMVKSISNHDYKTPYKLNISYNEACISETIEIQLI